MSINHLAKKIVFLSLSFNHISFYFCFQQISTKRTHFLKSFLTSVLVSPSTIKTLNLSFESQKATYYRAVSFLTSTFLNASLFLIFKLFKAFNFAAK